MIWKQNVSDLISYMYLILLLNWRPDFICMNIFVKLAIWFVPLSRTQVTFWVKVSNFFQATAWLLVSTGILAVLTSLLGYTATAYENRCLLALVSNKNKFRTCRLLFTFCQMKMRFFCIFYWMNLTGEGCFNRPGPEMRYFNRVALALKVTFWSTLKNRNSKCPALVSIFWVLDEFTAN